MESIKRAIKFQSFDVIKPILVFWSVVLLVDIIFCLTNLYGGSNFNVGMSIEYNNGMRAVSVVGSNLIAILVYLIVYSYEMYYETFPIAMSFSVTRKDFYKSQIINNALVSLIFALLQGTLFKIDSIFVNTIRKEPLSDFMSFNIKTDSVIFIILSLFIWYLAFVSVINIIAILNYKFGFKIWIAFGIIFLFLGINRLGRTIMIFIWNLLNTRIDLLQLLKIGLIIAISYTLVYFLTINTSIKSKAA